eukprot:2340485-Karenia_brevis.AAC.1
MVKFAPGRGCMQQLIALAIVHLKPSPSCRRGIGGSLKSKQALDITRKTSKILHGSLGAHSYMAKPGTLSPAGSKMNHN